MHSCAASVLLWAITSVGFWTFSITEAMVKVLPEPVTPRSTWAGIPSSTPRARASMAPGWSPRAV